MQEILSAVAAALPLLLLVMLLSAVLTAIVKALTGGLLLTGQFDLDLLLGLTAKKYLPNYGEFYERRWFAPASGSTNARTPRSAASRTAASATSALPSTSATRIRGDAAATRKKPSFLLAETQHCLVDLDTGGPFYPEIQSNGRSHISN